MLIRFRVENHRSIKNEQEISFVAAAIKDSPEKTTPVEKYGIDLLRVAGIYGANASGKSNVVDALQFMKKAVVDSHNTWKPDGGVPRKPFLLDPESLSEPSLFEVDILLNETRYTYGFIVDSREVLEEWLYAYPEGRKQRWFVRDKSQSAEFSFSRLLSGENKTIQGLTRPNSLFLSTAAQNNHHMLNSVFCWFSSWVEFVDMDNREYLQEYTEILFDHPKYKSGILSIMLGSDFGLTGIDIKEQSPTKRILRRLQFLSKVKESKSPYDLDSNSSSILLRHRAANGDDVHMSFKDESMGTQIQWGLAGPIIKVLVDGGLLCIDELDSSLHPDLAMEIVRWFNDPKKNPNNAQLMFNTHDTNILENELRRDQIWFTEKDNGGSTHLYSLSDFKPRKHENIKLGYMQGRYGGVPFMNIPKLVTSGRAHEEQ